MLGHDFKDSSGWPFRIKAQHPTIGERLSRASPANATESAAWVENAALEILDSYDPLATSTTATRLP